MSYLLTEDQQLIQKNARDFATQYLEPMAVQLDKSAEFPAEVVKKMASHDFLGWFLPAEFGGAEFGYVSYVLGVEELSRASAAVASIVVNHSSAAYAINRWGTAEQKKKYLPALARGEKLGAVAMSEPGPGVGQGPEAVIATQQADGYVLNGRKSYVANAGVADLYVVFGCTDPAAGAKSLAAFLVSAKAAGLEVGPKKSTMGLRARPTADVVFRNVAAELLGTVDGGVPIAAELLAAFAVAEAAETVGVVGIAVQHAAKYAQQRVQFGRPISAFQAIQTILAEVTTNCYVARLAVYDAAALIEQGKPFVTEAAMVKLFAQRLGMNSLLETLQIEGGYGYSEEMLMSKLFRDVSGTTILESPLEFPEQVVAASIA
jgi:alkylation response protein AidB-like acyl-CoA dehydrogenase